jgi:hypothetical protein
MLLLVMVLIGVGCSLNHPHHLHCHWGKLLDFETSSFPKFVTTPLLWDMEDIYGRGYIDIQRHLTPLNWMIFITKFDN